MNNIQLSESLELAMKEVDFISNIDVSIFSTRIPNFDPLLTTYPIARRKQLARQRRIGKKTSLHFPNELLPILRRKQTWRSSSIA